jgi:hypothetical protein
MWHKFPLLQTDEKSSAHLAGSCEILAAIARNFALVNKNLQKLWLHLPRPGWRLYTWEEIGDDFWELICRIL